MNISNGRVRVVGAGLAGCEAAFQLSQAGIDVDLIEMKPKKRTPAQVSDYFAELVCSNSLRSNNVTNAVGLLKEEMRRLNGLIISCADETRVPAGDALAVDRDLFGKLVGERIAALKNVKVISTELQNIPNDDVTTIIATGPLTSDALAADISKLIGQDRLSFYDAISPIVCAESIDMEHAFFESRWGKGDGEDYLNCPMTKEEYTEFVDKMMAADAVFAKSFEDVKYFEGCLPVEEVVSRGKQTLLFGAFKPVGLIDPKTQKRPFAVLQLRLENSHKTSYNLVGCQTRLKQPAQKEVFRIIPALKNANFLRFGAIHRNTYIDSPKILNENLALKTQPRIFFAGQITGVEGYVESAACGLLVGRFVAKLQKGSTVIHPPKTTALGGLYHHVLGSFMINEKQGFMPSNVNWSMIPPLDGTTKKIDKKKRREMLVERALMDFEGWRN